MTAKQVLDQLIAARLPITNGVAQTEDDDPNNLLGRPNGYLSRASFDVPGGNSGADKYGIDRGGVIEVWPNEAAVAVRSKYIQDALKNMPALGTEYHYTRGPVLVRISGSVKPTTANLFEQAMAALKM